MTKSGSSPDAPATSPPASQTTGTLRRRRKLAAIMMVDVSGFSRMMGQDEEDTVNLIEEFHRRVRELVGELEGRVVNTAGDSVFGEFDSVVNAVRCARRIQEEQGERNRERHKEQHIETRIGVHLGDVIVEDYTVYGDGVNIAARLEPLADPGGICISEAVYQQIRNKLDLPIEELGMRELKNIEHPIRVYKVPPLPVDPPSPHPSGAPRDPAAAATVRSDHSELGIHLDTISSVLSPGGQIEAIVQSWFQEIVRGRRLVPLIVGLALLLSPVILFPTGGVFPTFGAVLISIVVGEIWSRRASRKGLSQVALGIGIAAGAPLTGWSSFTNIVFVLAGLIVAAVGFSRDR